jgi:hypothetical protein
MNRCLLQRSLIPFAFVGRLTNAYATGKTSFLMLLLPFTRSEMHVFTPRRKIVPFSSRFSNPHTSRLSKVEAAAAVWAACFLPHRDFLSVLISRFCPRGALFSHSNPACAKEKWFAKNNFEYTFLAGIEACLPASLLTAAFYSLP